MSTEPEFVTLREFVDWYIDQGMPIKFPDHNSMHAVEAAHSVCIYRSGRYQVELYLMTPNIMTPAHCHPNVETIIAMDHSGELVFEDSIYDRQYHGGTPNFESLGNQGYTLIAFQKWDDGIEMTSASIQWSGQVTGKKHQELIQAYHPDAITVDGYADVRCS